MRFAPDSTFDRLTVYVDQFGDLQPYVLHGRHERLAELVNFFGDVQFGPGRFESFQFALGRIVGDLLTGVLSR